MNREIIIFLFLFLLVATNKDLGLAPTTKGSKEKIVEEIKAIAPIENSDPDAKRLPMNRWENQARGR